ncbi:MAG: FGGY-family carbohydrate kinase, partial [Planctomycetota bacterium]
LAEAAEPLRSVVDPDDPRLFEPGNMGERLRDACAARGEPLPDSDGALVRCALESVALATARAVRAIVRAGGLSPKRIVIVGGGSANGFLNQLVADATGLPVETGPVECTAIGNALLQHAALEGIGSAAPLRAIVRAAGRGGDGSAELLPRSAMCARMQDAAARLP